MLLVFGILSLACLPFCLPYPMNIGHYQQRQGDYPAIPTHPQVYRPPPIPPHATVRPKSKSYGGNPRKSKAGLRKRERRRKRGRAKYQKQLTSPSKYQIPTKYQQSKAPNYQSPLKHQIPSEYLQPKASNFQYPRQPRNSLKPPATSQFRKSNVASCGPNQLFHKKPRGGFCECKIGFFQLDSASPCIDHDECSTTPGLCGTYATCTNTGGSYTCSCQYGYSGHPPATPCVFDCSNILAVCGENADCQYDGDCYSCACKPGYCQYHLSM